MIFYEDLFRVIFKALVIFSLDEDTLFCNFNCQTRDLCNCMDTWVPLGCRKKIDVSVCTPTVLSQAHTVIRLLWVSAKFDTCTVVSVNGTPVEAKLCTFTLESTHFIFNLCPIYNHDGASAKFRTNSQETDYSACTEGRNRKIQEAQKKLIPSNEEISSTTVFFSIHFLPNNICNVQYVHYIYSNI